MKIIIVQIGRIGDTVLTTPVFRAIDESLSNSQIYALTSRRGAAVLQKNPRLKKVFIYRKDPISFLFLILRLRLLRFDWWIDPKDHYSGGNSLLAKVCGAKNKVGFNHGPHKTFSIGLPSDKDNLLRHVVERNLQSILPLGIAKPSNYRPELFPDTNLQKKIVERYSPCPTNTVLVNISAFHPERYWGIEKWAFVASACFKRYERVILTFKPDDFALAKALQQLVPGIMLFRSATIKEVIALMPQVGMVITPDTSIVHIASAFNIPQIALFSNLELNLTKFSPLSDKSIVIRPKHNSEFQTINENEVVEAMEKIVLEMAGK
jgi:ADP-heptose:LPS heptosyltransferase